VGGGIQARLLTATVGLWGNNASGAMAASQLLNKGKAGAKDVGESALRANPALVSVQNLLSQINRIASDARQVTRVGPYDQGKTALEAV
jgi:hypothetical protein